MPLASKRVLSRVEGRFELPEFLQKFFHGEREKYVSIVEYFTGFCIPSVRS